MQFIVIGYDGDDDNALARRMAVRAAHLKLGEEMMRQGKLLYGVALLNDRDEMVGSTLVFNFPSRTELDDWLRVEPYVTGDVWKRIDVHRCRVGSSPRPPERSMSE
jgi:uncharacterized protein YciI